MSRFHGPQPGYKVGTTKGVMRAYRAKLRKDAEERARKSRIGKIMDEELPPVQEALDRLAA